jgi:hypothetical protein
MSLQRTDGLAKPTMRRDPFEWVHAKKERTVARRALDLNSQGRIIRTA